jgi:hypothetical protein
VQAPLTIAKQIVLFCAEHAAQLAVDELVAECAQLVSEDAVQEGASRQLSARDLDDIAAFSLLVCSHYVVRIPHQIPRVAGESDQTHMPFCASLNSDCFVVMQCSHLGPTDWTV